MLTTDHRASGSARSSNAAPSSRSPCISHTSARRCKECASPAGASTSRCRSAASRAPARRCEVALQQRGLTDQRGREGHAPQRAGLLGPPPQPGREVDHLVVRDRAVEGVLRHAEMGVEHRRREPGLPASAAARSRKCWNHSPRWCAISPCSPTRSMICQVSSAGQRAGLVGRLPGRLDVPGEVGQAPPRQQQRRVGGVALDREVPER